MSTLLGPSPPMQDTVRARTYRGRRVMLLVFALCAAPVVLGTLAYFFFPPAGRVNYGTLIPPRPFDPPALLDGRTALAPDALADRWWLVTVGASACARDCEYKLLLTRQLRLAEGKDQDRIERLWIVTDEGSIAGVPAEISAHLHIARASSEETLARWFGGDDALGRIYLVDPLGNLMMSFPGDPDPKRMLHDLERLVRINSWQRVK